MNYCLCMLPTVEKYLERNTVYDLFAIAESKLLLQSHELKYILGKLGYVSNSGHWSKPADITSQLK